MADRKLKATHNILFAHICFMADLDAAINDGKDDIALAKVDDKGNTELHLAAQFGASSEVILGLIQSGLDPNTSNKAGDGPLHIAAKAGHVEACRALLDGGADALKRNSKNRRPHEVPKIPEATRVLLLEAEEVAKAQKAVKQGELWDEKMRATQTESAFIVRAV